MKVWRSLAELRFSWFLLEEEWLLTSLSERCPKILSSISSGVSHNSLLSSDLEMCDEAMAALDEVIMSTFQQSVYYLTKVSKHPLKMKPTLPFHPTALSFTVICVSETFPHLADSLLSPSGLAG